MSHEIGSSSRILVCALALAALAVIAEPATAQQKPGPVNRPDVAQKVDFLIKPDSAKKPDFMRYLTRPDGSMPLMHDWSNRHVIYTVGYTDEQADRMAKDPRAYASFLAHGMVHRHHEPTQPRDHVSKHETLKRDWSVSLGTGFLQASYAVYPAKYTFDVNAPASCANDFVVFPVMPTSTGSSRAKVVGTFTADPSGGQGTSITITPTGSSPMTLTLTAGTSNSGATFAVSGTNNTSTDAANLAAAVNRNLSSIGLDEISAVASSGSVTVYALTAGTVVTLSLSNDLSNFSWGTVTAGANGSQANIVGLNNLYAGSGSPLCAGYTYPTFTFSYAAGVGSVSTSPVLSLDGRKIAFVENDSAEGLGAILHLLTLGTGTEYGSCTNNGTAAPTCATEAVIPGGTAGSNAADYMLPLALAGGLSSPTYDADSSPFVDYTTDVLYVGDGSGNLYSVSPVFGNGTPALRSGFPVLIPGGGSLESPVVDVGNTGNIFIIGNVTSLYNVTSGGVVEGSISLGYGEVIRDDGPVLDSTNGVGYAVADCDGTQSAIGSLVQFAITATGAPEMLATVNLGASSCAAEPMFNATPDNNYFTKGISSSSPGDNGELLAAYRGSSDGDLVQLQFTSGIINTPPQYTDTDSGGFAHSYIFTPLTEFYGGDQAYPIDAVTQSGNTVTVTTTTNAFISNQAVVISGVKAGTGGCTSAAANAIDGEQTVTVTSSTTLTLTSAVNATIGGANGSCNVTSAVSTGPTQDSLFFATTLSSYEMFAFDLPLTSPTQTAAATNTTSVESATGGIIVDNDSSDGQASSIYFVTSSTTPSCGSPYICAVKVTQAGLN